MSPISLAPISGVARDAFRLLDAEWALLARQTGPALTVAGWLREAGALEERVAPLQMNSLLTLLKSRDQAEVTREHSDRWLGALLARAGTGTPDAELATQVVMKAMTPAAVTTTRRLAVYSGPTEDVSQVVVAALWQVVISYPLDRRPVKVAANLALDTLHIATRELARERPASWGQEPDWQFADPEMAPERMAEKQWLADQAAQLALISESGWEQATGRRGDLLDFLVWAVDAEVVTVEDARDLVRLVEEQHEAGVLRRPGVAEPARMRKRRSRAMQRLRSAVPEFLAETA
ncbi:hypothetical protein [Streptomyces xiamenensis]|uniref:hypothetical protein n=1 Tax=Streptomyces xiamenensis TaxID=408015 RepID=UPI0035DE0B1F